jgi:hypothetical protein
MRIRFLIAPVALLATSLATADVTEELTFSYDLNPGGRISLENINGNVTIVGGSGNSVEITAFKKADNQEYLDGIEININATDDLIRIETEHPDKDDGWFNWGDGGGSVTYTLSVPSGANLDTIESVNGGIEISGVFGVVKAETVNGGIDVEDLSDSASLETVNGSVRASFTSLTGDQRVECETVNGKMSLTFPGNADASITAETVNGGIDGTAFGLETNKGFVGRDLEGEIGDGSARVSLSTVNGGIKIRKS